MHIMKRIFSLFDEQNIKYVHFKSNLHLDYSFAGTGDFDILIDEYCLEKVKVILINNNGKRFNTIKSKQYPGVDNWLVMDETTGIIYHVHLHCQLISGKSLLKDYVIPWSDLVLNNRVYNKEFAIFTISPELELLLLLVRLIVKSNTKRYLKACLGSISFPDSMEQERNDLLNRVDWNVVESYISCLFGLQYHEDLLRIAKCERINRKDYLLLDKIVRNNLRNNRRMNAMEAVIKSDANRFLYMMDKIWVKLGKNVISKKTLDKSGLIIAFVGVDGAGKSTITKEIQKWMGSQISCHRFYMGSGDGKLSFKVRVLKGILRLGKRNKTKSTYTRSIEGNAPTHKKTRKSLLKIVKSWLSLNLVLSVEKANRKKIIEMHRLRLNSSVIILDRFPQIEVPLCNDGYKVCAYESILGKNKMYLKALEKERKLLSIVEEIKPDIIFKINISAATSMERKPEQTDISTYQMKIDQLNCITFQGANIIDIDGEKAFEEEIIEIKRIFWKYL